MTVWFFSWFFRCFFRIVVCGFRIDYHTTNRIIIYYYIIVSVLFNAASIIYQYNTARYPVWSWAACNLQSTLFYSLQFTFTVVLVLDLESYSYLYLLSYSFSYFILSITHNINNCISNLESWIFDLDNTRDNLMLIFVKLLFIFMINNL